MKIILYINQLLSSSDESLDASKKIKLNPENIALIDSAVNLRNAVNGTLTVITTGKANLQFLLREALARGCDDAILIEDISFGSSNPWPASLLVASEIMKIGFDVIITGYRTLDGISSYIGPQIAERLNIPQISYVQEIGVDDNSLIAKRNIEDRLQLIKVPSPCLLTMLNSQGSTETMSVTNIIKAFEKEIKICTYNDIRSYLCKVDPSIRMPHIRMTNKSYKKPVKKCKLYDLVPIDDSVEGVEQNLSTLDEAVDAIIESLREISVI